MLILLLCIFDHNNFSFCSGFICSFLLLGLVILSIINSEVFYILSWRKDITNKNPTWASLVEGVKKEETDQRKEEADHWGKNKKFQEREIKNPTWAIRELMVNTRNQIQTIKLMIIYPSISVFICNWNDTTYSECASLSCSIPSPTHELSFCSWAPFQRLLSEEWPLINSIFFCAFF